MSPPPPWVRAQPPNPDAPAGRGREQDPRHLFADMGPAGSGPLISVRGFEKHFSPRKGPSWACIAGRGWGHGGATPGIRPWPFRMLEAEWGSLETALVPPCTRYSKLEPSSLLFPPLFRSLAPALPPPPGHRSPRIPRQGFHAPGLAVRRTKYRCSLDRCRRGLGGGDPRHTG